MILVSMFLIIFLLSQKGVNVYAANVGQGNSVHDFPVVSENSIQDIEDLSDEENEEVTAMDTEEVGQLLHVVTESMKGQALFMDIVVKLLFVSTILEACVYGALIVFLIVHKFF